MKNIKPTKVLLMAIVILLIGSMFNSIIIKESITYATAEKNPVSVTDSSPWFSKACASGPWWFDWFNLGHHYIATYTGGSTEDCWAKFNPYLSQAGIYDVYASFYAGPDSSIQVPFTISYSGGSTTISVNQYSSSPTWKEVYLGTWNFNAGSSTYVRVTDATGEPYDGVLGLTIGSIRWVKQNQSPTCSLSANPNSGNAPLTVTFFMDADDPDGSISVWGLDADGNSEFDYQGAGDPPSTQTHIYTTPGSYTAAFMVLDNDSENCWKTQTIVVGQNQPPTCSFYAVPDSGDAPLTVTFYMDADDPDGSISSWVLVPDDGSPSYNDAGYPPPTQTHTYTSAGSYTALLGVTDNNGVTQWCNEVISVTPPNQAPICSLSAYPNSGNAPLTVTFGISAYDPDGSITSWELSPGDGSADYSGSGHPPATQSHTYTAAGSYTAWLSVIDNTGNNGSADDIITVDSPLPFPHFIAASVSNVIDQDLDGHARQFDVGFAVSTSQGTVDCYVIVYDYLTLNPLGTSSIFTVTAGTPSDVTQTVNSDAQGFQHETRSLKANLYEADTHDLVDTWTPSDNPNLANIKVEPSVEDESDPGDTLSTATVLSPLNNGDFIQVTDEIGNGVFGNRDVDLYRVMVNETGALTVDIDAEESLGSSLDAYLRLFDSSGTELDCNDDSTGRDPMVQRYLSPGTYYIGVSSFEGRRFNPMITDTANPGTTGEYQMQITLSISPPPGSDEVHIGSLTLKGAFELDSGDVNTATGTIIINDILTVYGSVSYNMDLDVWGNGRVYMENLPVVGNIDLYEGDFQFSASDMITNTFNQYTSSLKVVGLNVHASSIKLIPNGIEVRGYVGLPDLCGGIKLDFDNQHFVSITTNGDITYDMALNIPQVDMSFGGLSMKASNTVISLSNVGGVAEGTLTGLFYLDLPPMAEDIEVNLSEAEGNYFSLDANGQVDLVGSISVQHIEMPGGEFYVDDLLIKLNTVERYYYGEGTFGLPIVSPDFEVHATVEFIDGCLNMIGLIGDNLNININPAPPIYLQRAGGTVSGMCAPPLNISPELSLSAGPQIGGHTLLRLDGKVIIDLSGRVDGRLSVKIGNVNDPHASGAMRVIWDTNHGIYLHGNLAALYYKGNPVLEIDGKAYLHNNNNFQGRLDGTIHVPEDAPGPIGWWAGGETRSATVYIQMFDDGDIYNDYIIGAVTLHPPWGESRHAVEMNLNNGAIDWLANLDHIKDVSFPGIDSYMTEAVMGQTALGASIPVSFNVTGGLEWVMFRAEWETGETDLLLTDPFGNYITPANVDAYEHIFYGNNTAVPEAFYTIVNPATGNWSLSLNETVGIGNYTLQYLQYTDTPIITLLEPQTPVSGSPIDIQWLAVDSDSDATISLYYDTDYSGADGVLIETGISEDTEPNGSRQWNTTNVTTGEYYVYAVIDDGKNVPWISYAPGRITVLSADAPPQVTGLTTYGGNQSSVQLKWDASTAPDLDYYLVRYTDNAAGEGYQEVGAAIDPELTLGGLTTGETYRVAVAAVDTDGHIGVDSDPIVTVIGALATVPPETDQWGVFALPGETYSAKVPGSIDDTYTPIVLPPGATLNITGQFEWVVPATGASGWHEVLVHVTDVEGIITPERFWLLDDGEEPQWLSTSPVIIASSSTSIAIDTPTASDVSGAMEYLLERDAIIIGYWQLSPHFVDSGLDPDKEYVYRVKARDASPARLESVWTDTATGRTLAAVPPAPTMGNATPSSLTILGLSATANPTSTEYALYCITAGGYIAADGNVSSTPVWQPESNWQSLIIGGLEQDSEYSFQTLARNGNGMITEPGSIATVSTTYENIPPIVLSVDVVLHTLDLQLEFSEPVTMSMKDIHITDGDGQGVDLTGATLAREPGSSTVTVITNGVLNEGNYTLNLSGASVQDIAGNLLDGNNDGTPGDDYVFAFDTSSQDIDVELSLIAGWNMVSVPVTPADNSVGAVFPGVAGTFAWNATSGSYYMPTVIEPEKGYWVAVTEDTVVNVIGTPVETWTADIKAGWNMIGSVITIASIADPNDDPDESIIPPAYWWDPVEETYIPATEIEPGKGYWAASIRDCVLMMP